MSGNAEQLEEDFPKEIKVLHNHIYFFWGLKLEDMARLGAIFYYLLDKVNPGWRPGEDTQLLPEREIEKILGLFKDEERLKDKEFKKKFEGIANDLKGYKSLRPGGGWFQVCIRQEGLIPKEKGKPEVEEKNDFLIIQIVNVGGENYEEMLAEIVKIVLEEGNFTEKGLQYR